MSLHSRSSTWSSYRQLLEVVNASVFGRSEDLYQELEATLRRHKPDLLTLAEKPVIPGLSCTSFWVSMSKLVRVVIASIPPLIHCLSLPLSVCCTLE